MNELLRTAVLITTMTGMEPVQPAAPQEPTPVADAWLGEDKFRHFWMSYATTAFAFGIATTAGAGSDAALAIAVPTGLLAGLGKEARDRRRGEIFSARDLVADALGTAAAYFFLREIR